MLTINAERLLGELEELARIGATADGGVSRPALGAADLQARAWFKRKVAEAGLHYAIDGAGNQSAILLSDPPSDKRILAGSHLDSVPNGGAYDGALGLLVALEALRSVKEAGIALPFTLEAVNFTDEESAIMGLLGSRAVIGELTAADFARCKLSEAELTQRLQAAGLSRASMLNARRDDVLAWVELHIEQGTRLESGGCDIGVVNAIVGIRALRVTFRGEAAHAGTMPMPQRRDALWGAAAFIRRARRHVMERHAPGVCNVGWIEARPGAYNIVPAAVELALEFRHGSDEALDRMQAELTDLLQACAAEYNLTVSWEATPPVRPAVMSEAVMRAIESGAQALGLSHQRLLSFAGHDTQNMARIAPAAMFFVPSVNGISHNPQEFTTAADCVNGGNVMLQCLLQLARAGAGV